MTTESLATSDQSSDHEYVKHMLHFVGRAGIAATVPGMHAYAKAHVRRPTGAATAKQPEKIPTDLECFFFVAIEHSLEIAVKELVAKKAKPVGEHPRRGAPIGSPASSRRCSSTSTCTARRSGCSAMPSS